MKTVAVTGASGFIGTWMIKTLLERGYTIKASVRDLNDPKETDHLLALDGASERLTLMAADLLNEGAFDDLVEGVEGVFHMASPFFFETKDPQRELLDPAVKGTLNVLNSIAKNPSIKRVVLTSSEAAVAFNGRPLRPDVVVDETWWSDAEFCRKTGQWYLLSKLLAEQAAWAFCKEKGLDLVTICPAAVIGPILQPILNTSCGLFIRNSMNGTETFPNSTYGFVNVKNVVEAHILAMETPSANGRYLMVESVAHHSRVVEILRELYPDSPEGTFPTRCADDKPFSSTYQVLKERALSLGIKFIPLKESIKECADSLKAKGFC